MPSFFKSFFAALLALVVFTLLVFIFLVALIPSRERPVVEKDSVLVINLAQHFKEQRVQNPLAMLSTGQYDVPGLYDVIRLLQKAKSDKRIAGVYLVANSNPNGFAASEEIRNALLDFRKSGKFILAHGDVISQKAYGVANVADKVYVSPQGYLEWLGFSVDYAFLKGTLDKLEIQPQVFYAGKFKSATEPFRTDRMTPENQLQTSVWLNDLYSQFLVNTAEVRKIDTATLHMWANQGKIQTARDAMDNHLVDSLKYDDQVKDEIKNRLALGKYDRINFVSINSYMNAAGYTRAGKETIALIYAEGDIIDGKGGQGMIGSETYMNLLRKARLDQSIKAIVFRVNSGGGSSLASENIWRELSLAREEKPVVVSFGDVAASGGYYISCAADSIFALPNTITGSIGVFGIIPNMQAFFKNKLGVTFDGVKTANFADITSPVKPMNEQEKKMVQAEIETIYAQFKQRVAEGRKVDTAFVDSIAQGRVWTGKRAIGIRLVDRFGGIEDAVQCAARMAKLSSYQVRELPEPENFIDRLLGKPDPLGLTERMKAEMGEENFQIYSAIKRVKEMTNTAQARLPFEFFIH
jgi:protease-4